MTFPALGMVEPIYFISIIFFIFSFLNIAAYFMAKKNIDYELLFMALLNLLIGTFLFIMQYEEESFILGTFVLAYTIGTLLIKGYYTEILKRKIQGESIIKIAMDLNMSQSTVNRRIKLLKKKIMKVI